MFSRFFMLIDCGICGHIKAWWDNHPKCLFCSSCFRLSTCSICNLWSKKIWDLADKRRLYSLGKSTMKKKLAKKTKVVHSDVSDDSSFLDGSTTSQGFTAVGKTHLGGNYMSVGGTQSMSTRHQSASPVNQASGYQAPVNQAPGNLSLVNQVPSYQAPGNLSLVNHAPPYQAPVSQAPGNQSPII